MQYIFMNFVLLRYCNLPGSSIEVKSKEKEKYAH